MFRYYGIDLVAMICVIVAIWATGCKKRYGWLLQVIACSLYVAFGVMTSSIWVVIANVTIGVLAIKGYIEWGRDPGR